MTFSSEVAEELLVKAARCCCLCRKYKGTKLEIHHIIPKADGGTADLDNGIPICFDCHADVQTYNDRHPRGRKFQPSELKKLRDKWFELASSGHNAHFQSDEIHTSEHDVLFDCGGRVKSVRADLGLTISEFIENIGYPSERQFKSIEDKVDECPASVIDHIADFCGTSRGWLKTGKGQRYSTSSLNFTEIEASLKELNQLNPIEMYFCIELQRYNVLLAAQITEFKWAVFSLSLHFNFWQWIDDFRYIPMMYKFLDSIHNEFAIRVDSRTLGFDDYWKLADGEIYPGSIISTSDGGDYWSDDIRDIYHEYPIAEDYGKTYGQWFLKVQEYFRKYVPPSVPP